ncbi:MAG: transketolase [Candidatus Vogelbacteria bacterium]|nr:transketolase [Candidatus Vogelbacteria bacterium]
MPSKITKKIPLAKVSKLSQEIKRLIVEMGYRSKSGETGSALCISDIMAVLYFRVLEINPKKPELYDRDRFILSKGHGGAALYATLALRGFFPKKRLEGYRMDGGTFHLHPCTTAGPGIEVSTGSLGHGLSIGAGIALTMKQDCPLKKVFVLMGDGECNEGSVWEGAMFAATHKLSNLIVIVDENKFQGFGKTGEVHTMDLAKKWAAFGWDVFRTSGHNLKELEQMIIKAKLSPRPAVVLADTISGKSIPKIENTLLAHYFIPDDETYQIHGKKKRL